MFSSSLFGSQRRHGSRERLITKLVAADVLLIGVCMLCACNGVQAAAASSSPAVGSDSSEVGRVWFELGDEKAAAGDMEGAADSFFHALTSGFKPPDEAFRRFVMTYVSRGIPEEAYVKLGNSFQMQNNIEAARGSYQNAIQAAGERQSSGLAEATFRLGTLSDDDQAQLEGTVKAIGIDPTNAQFYYHLGSILFSKGKQFGAALEAFTKAYELDSTMDHAFGNMVYMKNRVCSWETFEDDLVVLADKSQSALDQFYEDRKVNGNVSKMSHFFHPHMTLALPLDPKLKLEITKTHALVESDNMRATMGRDPYTHRPSDFEGNNRIRVAYLSADFKLKATAYLVNHMYQFHNRDKFEVFCLANTEDSPIESRRALGLDWRQDISDSVEHFIDVSAMTSEEIVHLIHDKYKIHILINFDGYSNNGIRAEGVFAMQAAPLQVNMLVYVGTLGESAVQYVVTDPLASPAEYDEYYTEKFIWLPQSFFVNSHAHIKEINPPTLPSAAVVRETTNQPFRFCNFNKHLKISPRVFNLWADAARLIREKGVRTTLTLLEYPRDSKPFLQTHLETYYPDLWEDGFLNYLPFVEQPHEHYHRIADNCDVVLDNRNYNAHTMAVDTLFGGTPLLTFGDDVDFGGRVAISILLELGLDELVVFSDEEYVQMAVHLATDPVALMRLRRAILQTLQPSAEFNGRVNPFWDTARYIANLENGLEAIWDRFMDGEEPEHITVREATIDEISSGLSGDEEEYDDDDEEEEEEVEDEFHDEL